MVRLLRTVLICFAIIVASVLTSPAAAHPIDKVDHDRFLRVRLQKADDAPAKLRVRVDYRLEAFPLVLMKDMSEYMTRAKVLEYFPSRELEFYAEYSKAYAPVLADRLFAEVNKKRCEFHCILNKETLHDEKGDRLGHARCDFVFEAVVDWDASAKSKFEFQDQTYQLEPGRIEVSFANETGLDIENVVVPDEALRKKVRPGDDRLREIKAVLVPLSQAPLGNGMSASPPDAQPGRSQAELGNDKASRPDRFSLMELILHSDYGFWLTLLLAFVFGAAHALTPGHGKTLVAAYLVGERGTIGHAMFLGLVTTLTHTGVVILIAVIMTLLSAEAQKAFQKWVENGLGLALGLIVVCMGFWLLLQRLAGRADHVHIGDGHHAPSARELSWGGLVLLGVTGGMVPCWDAIILLFYTVGTSRFWLVLPAVLAFSAGLAVVLVLIGVLVVQAPRFIQSRGGDGKLLRSLPLISSVAVIAVGLWLCYEWSQG
jgi:nickel/cobalt exporter